jgi:non-ribosomal peptide synthetase component F
LAGVLDYATDIFDAPTVARLGRSFEALLSRIVANPESRLQGLRAELNTEEDVERGESRRHFDEEMRRRLETGKRRTVRG